ncbi:MAG: RNA polymerase sigma factor [Caulobacterales bacterium]
MSPAGEAGLVAEAQAGSAAAFARLVGLNQQAVRGFLRRLCRDHADADDLAQETFITAWSRIGAFRPGESLRSWLIGVAYRKWLGSARADARRARRERAAWQERVAPDVGSPDGRLDAAAALRSLPAEQRAAVALCLAAGFSHAEAAEALALPLGTVKSHVARGRAKLAEQLGLADD